MRNDRLGIKVSGAIRRLGNARARNRHEWREAKAYSDAAYAQHVWAQTAQPRIVAPRQLRALPLADFLAAAQSPAIDVHSVTLPTRAQVSL